MAQETAVDFLLEKMSNLGVIYAEGNVLKELNDSIKKAIAMEKGQIMSAYDLGNQNQHDKICISNYVNIDEEQYYNQIYNK